MKKSLNEILFEIDKWEEQVYILEREITLKCYDPLKDKRLLDGFKVDITSLKQRLKKLYEQREAANENNV